jgi:hypothetical protein
MDDSLCFCTIFLGDFQLEFQDIDFVERDTQSA